MYNDYLNDEFDDAIDEYNSFMDDYDSDLTDLKMQEWQVKDECKRQLREVDEYWDRENKYIKTSGIYTKEEITQILEQHEEIRRNKKKEILERFDFDMDMIEFDKEQLEMDREQAESDLEFAMQDREFVQMDIQQSQDLDSRQIAAQREELAAYSDFIASLDEDK